MPRRPASGGAIQDRISWLLAPLSGQRHGATNPIGPRQKRELHGCESDSTAAWPCVAAATSIGRPIGTVVAERETGAMPRYARSSSGGSTGSGPWRSALDWPGWSRGAKSPELAVETLETYRERYRPIARSRGHGATSSTGAGRSRSSRIASARAPPTSGASPSPPASLEQDPMSADELEGGSCACCGPAGSSSTASGRGCRPRCARGPWRRPRARRDHRARHPHRERGLREAGRDAHPRGNGADRGRTAGATARPTSRRCGSTAMAREAADAQLDAAVPGPPLGLPYAGPCVGDGGQGPLRPRTRPD